MGVGRLNLQTPAAGATVTVTVEGVVITIAILGVTVEIVKRGASFFYSLDGKEAKDPFPTDDKALKAAEWKCREPGRELLP
jgi:hypothetical protein